MTITTSINILEARLRLVHLPRTKLHDLMSPIIECWWFRPEGDPFFALCLNHLEVSVFADATIVRKTFGQYMSMSDHGDADGTSDDEDEDDDNDDSDDDGTSDSDNSDAGNRIPRTRQCTVTGNTLRERTHPGQKQDNNQDNDNDADKDNDSDNQDKVKVGSDIWVVLEIAFHGEQAWETAGQRLQQLSSPLADAGISIMYCSTYHADYILLRQTDLTTVTSILQDRGFRFNEVEDSDDEQHGVDDVELSHETSQQQAAQTYDLETSLSSRHTSSLRRANSGSTSRRSGAASLSGSLTLSDQDVQQTERGRRTNSISLSRSASVSVMSPIRTIDDNKLNSHEDDVPLALDDSLTLLPDELIQIGLAQGATEPVWRTKIVSALFYPERVLPLDHSQKSMSTTRYNRSMSMSSSFNVTSSQLIEQTSTYESPYPAPFIALIETCDGSSLTADVRLLRSVFQDQQQEDEMVYAIGQGGLRGVWQGEDGIVDQNESQQDVQDHQSYEKVNDENVTEEWEQIERLEVEKERLIRKQLSYEAGQGGRRLLKCLQLDLSKFGLDKHGIVDSVAGILANEGINVVYQSTFSSANVLVAKTDIRRARQALEAHAQGAQTSSIGLSNLTAIALPVAWVVAISPHWYAAYLSKVSKDLQFFDNRAPREFLAKVRAQEKQTPDTRKYLRAEAAQQNSFENLPVFLATLAAGHAARLPTSFINKFITFYIASRVLYSVLYIQTTRQKFTGLRSLVYVAGIGACSIVWFRAANVWV
ncbi:hypothetical protein OIO90_002592 [Microbotryomycetes sp. JL221]|nr:hypothetical protein OIO90_002592 [Microbotryomycetes sp. JL221]